MYLASVTRPDISSAVSKLSWFTSNPGDYHWRALDCVMHYLAGTMDYRIHFSGYPAILERYSDANWISDVDELYAMSGYVFTLGGASISWRSCKQITSNPGDDHWHALERVMHYLAGTMDYGIHYSGYPAVLEGYSDANLYLTWMSCMP
jgi:hypothetical protein